MATEQGSTAASGGLRREHVVAAAIVAAVTVVLGFASGFGIVDAGAAPGQSTSPPSGLAGPGTAPAPVAGAPSAQPRGAARQAATAAAQRPGSRPVRAQPYAPGFAGSRGSDSSAAQAGAGDGVGVPPEAAAPGGQCSPGLLGAVLALVTSVLGGAPPTQALSTAGAVPAVPAGSGGLPAGLAPVAPGALWAGPVQPGSPGDVPMYLPVDGRWMPVTGLVALLDAVSYREQARTAAGLAPLPEPQPAAGAPGAPPPGSVGQLGVLSGLLAPLGIGAGPGAGPLDLLAPVWGSAGCAPAAPAPAAVPGAPVAAPAVGLVAVPVAGGAGR